MKKQLQTALVLGLIFLKANTFGQTTTAESKNVAKEKAKEETYLSPLFNMVTNFNYENANNSLSSNKKSLQGVQIGVTFQAGISPLFSVVSELYFITKGGRLNENSLTGFSKTTIRLYTMEFPLLARFNIGKIYLNAGPSISYNISGTRKAEGISNALSFNNSIDGFNRWDAGVQMGAGYRFKIKQKPVAMDIRYAYDVTKISNLGEMHNKYLNIGLYITQPWEKNPLGKNRNL